MRTLVCLTALLAAQSIAAQGVLIPLPAFARTFSSNLTRGFYFQAPVPFNIVAAQVPDEAAAGVQNIEIYVLQAAPPAFSATVTPAASELRFSTYNTPVTGTPIATGSITVAPNEWVVVLGATGTTTMNNSYAAPGPFQTTLFGQPITLTRCGTQFNIFTTPGPSNPIWSEAAFEVSRVELYVTPRPGFILPPELVATAEITPFSGTLGRGGGAFRSGDTLRWNFNDPTNVNGGLLIWNTFNYGFGGSAPIGSTALIPGLNQVWAASTPTGIADLLGPTLIGNPDTLVVVPPGLFNFGDTVRMQGIVLDPRVGSATQLPINPTLNSIEFTYTDCIVAEDFDTLATGVGVYPTGWSNGGGGAEWSVNSGGTTSGSTGPNGAVSAPNYLYCETSSPVTGRTFIVNTATYATNTFVNNTLEFQLSRVGATIGTLEVRMDDGTGTFSTLLATYTGAEPSGLEWTAESIALPTPLPANVQFQFNYAQGASFTGDIAIDSVCIR